MVRIIWADKRLAISYREAIHSTKQEVPRICKVARISVETYTRSTWAGDIKGQQISKNSMVASLSLITYLII